MKKTAFLNKANSNKSKFSLFRTSRIFYIANAILLVFLFFTLTANQIVVGLVKKEIGLGDGFLVQAASLSFLSGGDDVKLSGNLSDDVVSLVISRGLPEIYGQELGVSFDQVQQSINIMRQFDPDYGMRKITLTGDDKQRYIDVAIRISCEYCCGAKSIISQDGSAACGCAHSIAMRGLLAYLIQNHGAEYSNDELLRELARWKGVYFPKQMIKKLAGQLQGAQFTPDTASLVLDLDLPKYSEGGGEVPLPSEIKNLPSMVGGC